MRDVVIELPATLGIERSRNLPRYYGSLFLEEMDYRQEHGLGVGKTEPAVDDDYIGF
jgi:hypothetical protein